MQTAQHRVRPIPASMFANQVTIYEVKQIKPYSGKELSDIYGISVKTFLKWLKPFTKEVGDKKGRFYNVLQVEIIFARLGLPYKLQE